ncbi:hypothetical protein CONPUDRAFT_89328 [Coniophora puteana RWD-64-598 SS2]|uniref:Muskelin N-terminal domain-containing protein n=1 Tax=Coniophora puteana (strain RWD-64-598) TaxID=741705 RepID=A0A5M3MWC5_CONPW|nr:uncharacterized protein CONPUDRAFT_89328 [Coniophora puteana RWD-64-598 SS2]EIW83449.1 hypothetical protein CONPUDRAFT_89328 [Coniophora puteana RWD-64-598 SS2]
MKEFKIFVGLTPDHMMQVLHSTLKDDSTPETFPLAYHTRDDVCFPTQYLKIVPLTAHGQSFHISIWHVALAGTAESGYIKRHREEVVLRRILKHLRQRRLLTPFHSILARSTLYFEHPLVTALHAALVLRGDWPHAEALVRQASDSGLFAAYLQACQPHARWTRIRGTDADGDVPCRRGGHAMCLDSENGLVYLFGGWDGAKSLDDFWVYDVRRDRWRILSGSTAMEKNGPVARSCHKMVFDSRTGSIYLLGRLGDGDVLQGSGGGGGAGEDDAASSTRAEENAPREGGAGEGRRTAFCSEFYRYRTRGIDQGKWELLSFDTASSGGPPLIFDHQMVMDSNTQILYVSGGRVVDGDWESPKYSGLYSYNVRTSKWKLLQPTNASSGGTTIPPRFGHSMVLDPIAGTLFVFAGQRDDKYLADMYAYDLHSDTAYELFSNFSAPDDSPSHPRPASSSSSSGASGHRGGGYSESGAGAHTHAHAHAHAHARGRVRDRASGGDSSSGAGGGGSGGARGAGGGGGVGPGPDACFTQRAVIDPALKEIYVFCGLTRAQQTSPLTVLRADAPNWVYTYASPTRPGVWTQILPEVPGGFRGAEGAEGGGDGEGRTIEAPLPRYAHQVVYDEGTNTVFMHGGNAGEGLAVEMDRDRDRDRDRDADMESEMDVDGDVPTEDGGSPDENVSPPRSERASPAGGDADGEREDPGAGEADGDDRGSRSRGGRARVRARARRPRSKEMRLDDFWRMRLSRAAPGEVVRQATYEIRRQQFREMCEGERGVKALRFLQTEVSAVVDHASPEETAVFRSLLAHLLSSPSSSPPSPEADTGSSSTAAPRTGGEDVDVDMRVGPAAGHAHQRSAHAHTSPGYGDGEEEEGEEGEDHEQEWTSTLDEDGEDEDDSEEYDYDMLTERSSPALPASGRPSRSSSRFGAGAGAGAGAVAAVRKGGNGGVHDVLALGVDPLEASMRNESLRGRDAGRAGAASGSASAGGSGNASGKQIEGGAAGAGAGAGALGDEVKAPGAERWEQRTRVFEGLLRFFGEECKQPDESLVDGVDFDD